MTTLSLISRNCGSQGGNSDRAIESGLETCIHKDFFAGGLLIGSVRRLNGVWLKNLGSPRIESRNRFHVVAKIRKGKKHDYPWPDDIDPNLSSGHLSYLSYFKPLKEKPKPVTLAFEKPLVRRMADETGLDFSDQISSLESKYQQALKDLYAHLTPIQRLTIARHPNRPTVLDHILNITDKDKWVELHGDRAGYDDPAIVTGIGSIDGKSFMFIGHQKGRNTKENIERNFAMPTPHGYRKALRMMKYADHHGFPIITFIDTPGAFADLKSEELGQGEAIAQNLRTMFSLKVPIISVVTGEGGSGGALAIGCANKLFMLENSAFYVARHNQAWTMTCLSTYGNLEYRTGHDFLSNLFLIAFPVISPEACAAILWKSAQAAPKAAEKLRITAQEHYRLRIADGVIPEPLGGAHADPVWTSQQIKLAITQAMEELGKMDTEELIRHRMLKYRPIGGAKKKILEAEGPSEPITSLTIKKLEEDVDQEITNAFISMGLQEKLESLQLELSKAPDVPNNQTLNWALKEKVDRIMQEFDHNLTRPGAYLGLKQKLEMLNMAHRLIEHKEKAEKLKAEINQKVPAEVKAKMEVLKEAQQKLSKGDPFDKDLVEEVQKAKNELKEVLKLANLEIIGMTKRNVPPPPPDLAENIAKVNEEIGKEIERAINVTGLNGKIEELKAEVAKGSSSETVEN
ncbi:Acetyl-coenzyme A carboxylase carboxyl transferase subunit alpha, chloroplastic [Vitis vinifera]|uniref:acetyl-CoA carboxytransferase n=1 Tax=Vitis vinifera TaxID=29760 RepID=A0A438GSQ5_VITVI|nr:Acetyl-coenzyme A carboxylase carboxyl transferase subunit alpha, chloroplastic [Vitis vinifera]